MNLQEIQQALHETQLVLHRLKNAVEKKDVFALNKNIIAANYILKKYSSVESVIRNHNGKTDIYKDGEIHGSQG